MSRKYSVGGYATFNGIVLINATLGKVVRAARDKNGTIYVKDLVFVTRVIKIYKDNIEKVVSKIPGLREIFNMFIMFIVAISSILAEVFELFSFKTKVSIKSFIPNIFKNHGAEHKCINMYEGIYDEEEMNVENMREFSRIHVRCGTNIIVFLLPFFAVYYFILYPYLIMLINEDIVDLLSTFVLLGISIELLNVFRKHSISWILRPGLFIQRVITTKEPDDKQLEVAFAALKGVIS